MNLNFKGLSFLLFSIFYGTWAFAQTNRIFLAGGQGNERFNTVFQLSDSTVLIGGEADNLSWIPTGVPIITLDTLAGQGVRNGSSASIGFILHASKDLNTILRVLRLPPNTLESINKIKATSKPGDPTGEIYFSGRRDVNAGYFIGRLNNNFVNGVPNTVSMGLNLRSRIVSTGAKHQYDGPSYHRLFQPWDVDADGKILAASGEEFDFNWSFLGKYKRNGDADSVEYFPFHEVILDGGNQWPQVTGRMAEVNTRRASQMPDSVWVRVIDNVDPIPDVFDSVKVTGVAGSGIVLKSYRAGAMRSQTQAEYDLLQNDENGNAGRKSFRPDDYIYNAICTLGTGNCPNTGPGYLGYGPTDIWNGRVGDVVIDKRNGDMYFTYTLPTEGPAVQTQPRGKATKYDMQPVLVAMRKNGEIKWWARLMREALGGNSADQITDGLAIDYQLNSIVILGRVYDTCTHNYWKGNEIALNPGGNGFQNSWTGPDPKIEYSWLAKYDMANGRIRFSTYVAENAKNAGNTGAPLANPVYDGWPNPNAGNPRLAETVTPIGGSTLQVDQDGNVYLISSTKGRAITTANAYQKMLKPAQGSATDSLPPGEYPFVRIYNPSLSGVLYSSAIAGIWNPQDSSSRSPVSLAGLVPTGNGFFVVGSHQGKISPSDFPYHIGTINAPSWASDSLQRFSGLAGVHKFGQVSFIASPLSITGPASHCPGEIRTYSIPPVAGATQGYQWILPGNNWQIVGPANGNSIQLRFTGSRGGQLRVVAKNENGISQSAILNIPDAPAPLTVQTAGFVCATGGSATLTALGGTPGNYRWYTDSLSNTPIANEFNSAYVVTGITSTTRFWVSQIGGNGCESERRGVNARFGKSAPAINPLPANGPPYNALQAVPPSIPPGVTARVWRKDGVQIGTGGAIPLSGPSGVYTLCFTNPCGDSCVSYIYTSIQAKLAGLEINLFPNPAYQDLNILLSGERNGDFQVEIQDVLGKSLMRQVLNKSETDALSRFNIQALKSGLYFISLSNGKERTTLRFVKP
jgi:hypothetical protein